MLLGGATGKAICMLAGASGTPPPRLAADEGPDYSRPKRNLALELVRVTEAGALASGRWMGKGDKNAADQVRAMASCACCATSRAWHPHASTPGHTLPRVRGSQAAVDMMRTVLNSVAMDGVVVIGEGEKDEVRENLGRSLDTLTISVLTAF